MGNLIKKEYYTNCSWVAPAGVTQVKVTAIKEEVPNIGAGFGVAAALDLSGKAYSWGTSYLGGALGDGAGLAATCSPKHVLFTRRFRQVSVGYNHMIGIDNCGLAVSWGGNGNGQLGVGICDADPHATVETVCCNFLYKMASSGSSFNVAINTAGALYAWGANTNGQLGDGSVTERRVPTAVCTGGVLFKSVAAGNFTSAGISVDGDAYVWGYGFDGQVGNAAALCTCVPTAVCGGLKFKQLSVSTYNVFGLTCDGDIYAWGGNGGLQLGVCSAVGGACSPVAVCTGGVKFKCIASGSAVAAAISVDGMVYSWGAGTCGGLGDGTLTAKCVPTLAIANNCFQSIVASPSCKSFLAVDCSGKLYGWGHNLFANLGNGGTTQACSPTLACCNYWFDRPKQRSVRIVDVIPGQTYQISVLSYYASFGGNDIDLLANGLVVEYWA